METKRDRIIYFLKKPLFCFLLIWIFCTAYVSAEKPDTLKINKNFILSGNAQYGKVLATNPYLIKANALDDKYIEFAAISFQMLKQTTGDKYWEQNYGFPIYGFGVYSASFFDNKDFGTPIALYGVFQAPFRRWNNFSLNYEVGFGLTFNWDAFNPAKNYYNISMGAAESVFIDLGIKLSYSLSSHFDLGIGYCFTHFSNGALKSPNYGLNTFSPKINLGYRINKFNPLLSKQAIPFFNKNTTVDFSIFGGVKNVIYKGNDLDSITKYKGVYYPVFGLSTVINRQVSYKSKLGFGVSISYDGSYNSTVFIDNGRLEPTEGIYGNKLSLSIFPSYELVISELSMIIQPGFYVLRKKSTNKEPVNYQRIGLHYQFGKNMFAGICLRAYSYHVSDFIEWTLGYRLSFLKRNQ